MNERMAELKSLPSRVIPSLSLGKSSSSSSWSNEPLINEICLVFGLSLSL